MDSDCLMLAVVCSGIWTLKHSRVVRNGNKGPSRQLLVNANPILQSRCNIFQPSTGRWIPGPLKRTQVRRRNQRSRSPESSSSAPRLTQLMIPDFQLVCPASQVKENRTMVSYNITKRCYSQILMSLHPYVMRVNRKN